MQSKPILYTINQKLNAKWLYFKCEMIFPSLKQLLFQASIGLGATKVVRTVSNFFRRSRWKKPRGHNNILIYIITQYNLIFFSSHHERVFIYDYFVDSINVVAAITLKSDMCRYWGLLLTIIIHKWKQTSFYRYTYK